ncbi:MAG: transcriptional regulator [Thaumarchaeota archaeon]|nr:MAG: transcriptional regulator [Nitrososphaerota archaeon]
MTTSTIKTFLKQQNRGSLAITRDILQACMHAGIEGILISKISQNANLSYNTVRKSCQKLIDADLIKSVRSKRSYIFIITEKGIKFFHEFQKFQDTIMEINIRY